MHALGILPPVSGHAQAVVDGDSLDHQHVVLGFNLANRLYLEAVPLDFDLTRFQRAGKGAGQSAAGRGYHVVERRRMRRELLRRNVVMLGNLRVDAEHDRLLLAGQVRETLGAAQPLDPHARDISRLSHGYTLPVPTLDRKASTAGRVSGSEAGSATSVAPADSRHQKRALPAALAVPVGIAPCRCAAGRRRRSPGTVRRSRL